MQGGLAGGRFEIKDVSSLFLLLFFLTLILPNPIQIWYARGFGERPHKKDVRRFIFMIFFYPALTLPEFFQFWFVEGPGGRPH